MAHLVSFHGRSVAPQVGTCIVPDNWSPCGHALLAGDSFSTFRIQTCREWLTLAVEIEVTGRTPVRRYGSYYVRVRIIFKGDGEPDTIHYGWMLLPQ